MSLSVFTIVIPLFYYYHIPAAANTFTAPHHHPIESLAINCGSHGNSTALDGREWTGDTQSSTTKFTGKSMSSSPAHNSLSSDFIPYSAARISHSPFTYSFQIDPGQKIIRFHFNPSPYRGFKSSIDLFTVRAGPFTLLSNFSPSVTAAATGVKSFIKEYCLSVEETQALDIKFYPSRGSNSDKTTYAFVNGIEIVSMPAGLYYTREGDLGAKVVGHKYHFYIDSSTALEMIGRLNVGGKTILPVEDSGMFRGWSADSDYLVESNVVQVTTFTYVLAHFAPMKVYQTTWSTGSNKQENEVCKITWRVPVDLGFRYLVRLHFSEHEAGMSESGHDEFGIRLNTKIVEAHNDMIKWSNGNHIASCRDYVVAMEGDKMQGKHDLLISMQLKCTPTNQQTNAKLHGIEIFKLSNLDNNLAGLNPLPPAKGSKTRFSMAFGHKNAIATGITLILTLLSVIVYRQRVAWEANCKKGIPISPEKRCRHFSLAEIRSATGDFDGTFVIGKGGFGYVYKGLIGADTVAIKRSNPMSDQGPNEFWTEIEMLSKLWHTNLVPFLGYCNENQEMILVYEYMDYGTLADHLHKIDSQLLTWEQRLEICIGAARGLDYLHTGGGDQQRVVHRDVKSSNILLDKHMVAKISDFGLSKVGPTNLSWTHVSTNVRGTFGYLDPEYFMLRRLTTKSDVYSFGVVMFEVLCGRRAVDLTLEEEQRSLAQWVQSCMKHGLDHQIVDPNLRDQIVPKSLKVFIEIAVKCLNKSGNRRPTMADVVVSLEYALQSQNNTNSGTNEDELMHIIGDEDSQVSMDLSAEQENIIKVVRDGNNDEEVDESLSGSGMIHASTFGQVAPSRGVLDHMSPTSRGRIHKIRKKENASTSGPSRAWWLESVLWKLRPSKPKSPSLPINLVRRFSLAEIQAATRNFHGDLFIGRGYFGETYKGHSNDIEKEVFAIKRFSGLFDSCYCRNVIELLSRIQHRNVVQLIGYCKGKGGAFLVFPFLANGSLHDQLYPTIDRNLTWKRRLQICVEIAKGLNWLHTSVRIIHRDLKPSNILLDENWIPKISSFEIGKSFSDPNCLITPGVRGTKCYLDPECTSNRRQTTKSDVYSFGMVLLEVLCAREPVIRYTVNRVVKTEYLQHSVKVNIRKGTLNQIIDPSLAGEISTECLCEFIEIALKCLLHRGVDRPATSDVLEKLEYALQLQESAETEGAVGGFKVDPEFLLSRVGNYLPLDNSTCISNAGSTIESVG